MHYFTCTLLAICSATLATGHPGMFDQFTNMAQGMLQNMQGMFNPKMMEDMMGMAKNGGFDDIQKKMGEIFEKASQMPGEAAKKMQEVAQQAMTKMAEMKDAGTATPQQAQAMMQNMLKQMNA